MGAPAQSTLAAPGGVARTGGMTRLLGIGTATPAFSGTQREALEFMEQVLVASFPEQSDRLGLLRRIYLQSGIERRYTVMGDYVCAAAKDRQFFPRTDTLEPFPSTAMRMAVYEREAPALAKEAAEKALRAAGVAPERVTHLVISTCTGFFAPGPDVLLAKSLGLRSSVRRSILGFMGCYAGVSGIRICDEIVRGNPDAIVLQVAVELCSLHYQKDLSPDTLVANAIFADGASAAVYGREGCESEGRGFPVHILACHSEVRPDSLESMGWRIGDTGFVMRLGSEVPRLLNESARPFIAALAAEGSLSIKDIDQWAVHPGGRKIVEAVEEAMELDDDALLSSHHVLRDYGNMSSATILFVLEDAIGRAATRGEPGVMAALAFGPGLTMEGALLQTG